MRGFMYFVHPSVLYVIRTFIHSNLLIAIYQFSIVLELEALVAIATRLRLPERGFEF
jgi:hypothetical protein